MLVSKGWVRCPRVGSTSLRPATFATRKTFCTSLRLRNNSESPVTDGISYSSLTVGAPREIYPNERRVSLTPTNVRQLLKKGFKEVLIEKSAGASSSFPDSQYLEAGARLVSNAEVFGGSDVLLKVRPPIEEQGESVKLKEGGTLISFLYPTQNKWLLEDLKKRNVTSFAMDQIPRISRAQVFDALSSMANIAGYKAVLEASNLFGRYLTGQVTAAGKIPPSKTLVIGAGVAGLSAIATARRMGSIVRGFDTREAVKEQIQSLGAEFLTVDIQEEGSGTGGYAKEMSKEFIEAEMKLFMEQAMEVDIIITTALIPGKPAPRLITAEMVEAMKPGSVIVDLAAEAGGNCELTKPGELYEHHNGVKIVGYTDLPSRLPTQSSTLYSNNITKFLLSIGNGSNYSIDLKDEVIRRSIITHQSSILWPAPIPPPPPVAATAAPKVTAVAKEEPKPVTPFRKVATDVGFVTAASTAVLALGKATTASFMDMFTFFGLASLVGYKAVWSVTPALHSPLMSVTNAISGLVGVGGMLLMGGGIVPQTLPQAFAAASVFMANVNIFGGFVVTKRMLDMFRRPGDPPDYQYLYLVPALAFGGGYLYAAASGLAGLVQAGYAVSSFLSIAALSGLSSQVTARMGNALGAIGVGAGILTTLSVVGFSPEVMAQFGLVTGLGALLGTLIGGRISAMQLPQTVAALHSVVGLAAVLTSIASVLSEPASHLTMLHMTTAYLGVLIGGITFTGSVVAFLKLAGKLSSKPTILPGRHLINSTLLGTNIATMGAFLTMAPGSLSIAATCLAGNTILSFLKGWTTTSAIGGADMPVVITVLNAYSGFALIAEGFMLENTLLTTVGSLIAASGSILSYIMCRAMNRSLTNVLFGGIAPTTTSDREMKGVITKTSVEEVVEMLGNAENVIIVPGYGMAVSKAQFAIKEMLDALKSRGVSNVRFAVHPVAGRMPGQCNVLLAEAGVPYDVVLEMDEINEDFPETDVVIVIGANDTVNPIALEEGSSIAGMPIINAYKAKNVIVMKRGMAAGYADVPNPLFYQPNCKMLFGDAKPSCEAIVQGLKEPGK